MLTAVPASAVEPVELALSTANAGCSHRAAVPPGQRPRLYFPALTGLRFVLAIWVIMHHLIGKGMMLEEWSQSLGLVTDRLLQSGYLAVQTFFILSGFVLAQSYASTTWNRTSLRRYGIARFARIYPVYLLSLLVVSRFILDTLSYPGRSALQKLTLLGDYGFILLGWTGPLSVGWNTPAWTLSCEIFFYLCFPLIFLYLANGKPARILTALAVCFVVPVLLAHAGVPSVWKPIHHLSDFVAGIAAAELYRMMVRFKVVARRRGYWLYLPALALSIALIAYPGILRGIPIDLNTALRPLNIALLIGLAADGGLIARVLSTSIAEYLGKSSYAMYILHVPLLWWYSRYAFHKLGAAPHTGAALIYLGCVVAISIIAFEIVESPANRWLRLRAFTQPEPDLRRQLYAMMTATLNMANFNQGAQVEHQKFGLGTVLSSSDERIIIKFDDHGEKKFVTPMVISSLKKSDRQPPAEKRASRARKPKVAVA